jgi:hypothetical protein
MSSARRSSSGTGSIRGSFFNQKPSNNTQRISSHKSSQRKSSNRSSSGRTSSRKNRKSSGEKNYINVLDFTPENEGEISHLKTVVYNADELRRNNEIMNDEKIFDEENMEDVRKKDKSIKERTKDLLRQRKLIELIKKTENLYREQDDYIKKIKPTFFNNSKLRKHEKLRNGYGKQLNYLYSQIDIIDNKLGRITSHRNDLFRNELLKDVGLLNKRLGVLNNQEGNPNSKYYNDKFFTRKYNKSSMRRGGSRRTRRRKC